MNTPFFSTIKYFFLCLSSLEIMHVLIRSALNFTYIIIATLIMTILYSIDIRKPISIGAVKVENQKNISVEKKAL